MVVNYAYSFHEWKQTIENLAFCTRRRVVHVMSKVSSDPFAFVMSKIWQFEREGCEYCKDLEIL